MDLSKTLLAAVERERLAAERAADPQTLAAHEAFWERLLED